MIAFDAALALIAEHGQPLARELVPLGCAQGRVLAEPVIARTDAPATDVSAMDGIAVRDADLSPLPATLHIVGTSFAGEPWRGEIGRSECVRIFTGAPLPQGADRVVMQEHIFIRGNQATVTEGYGPGWHVRAAGSDFRSGDVLIPAGTRLGPRQLLCVAAADQAQVSIWRRPRVAILSTGTELVPAGGAQDRPDRLPDSVSPGIAALVDVWGGEVIERHLAGDNLAELVDIAGIMLHRADILVVTGGASVGERDHAKDMLVPHGLELFFSKIAMKPGKPVWFGRCGSTLVVGLPGNPTSAMVTARLILAPLLAIMSGLPPETALAWKRLPVDGNIPPNAGRENFFRAQCVGGCAVVLSSQDSGSQKILAAADLLVRASTQETGEDGPHIALCLDF